MKVFITRQVIGGYEIGTEVELSDNEGKALIAAGTAESAETILPGNRATAEAIRDEKRKAKEEADKAAEPEPEPVTDQPQQPTE